jgi:hypothetical protein
MEECLEDIKMDMHILQEKIEELEYEFSKLSYCDKFCMLLINKCIEWKVYVRKMLKQS